MVRIKYTPEDKQSLINYYSSQGLILIEEQKYASGDFLIFDTQPKPPSLEERIRSLENKVKVLEGKVG